MLGHLIVIDRALSADVASRLGVDPEDVPPASPAVPPQTLPPSAALSAQRSRAGGLRGRCVGLLVLDGANTRLLQSLKRSVGKAGATVKLITPTRAGVWLSDRTHLPGEAALDASPSCLFVAVAVLGSDEGVAPLLGDAAALSWLRDAWRHLKVIGLEARGQALAAAAGIGQDEAVVALSDGKSVDALVACAAWGKHRAREGAPGTDT
jgi:catalase